LVGFCARSPDFDRLKAQGNTLVAAAEAYRSVHGVYPASLEVAGAKPPWTLFGRWRYEVHDDGRSYNLQIADYGRDGFTMWYNPERNGDWRIDT
jgi:hypothetical protein